MPGTNLVAVRHVLHPVEAVRRPRTGAYVLMGLAISGWMGFLVLAGVLLATRSAIAPEPALGHEAPRAEPALPMAPVPRLVMRLQVDPERASSPVLASLSSPAAYSLTAYEERRRVQEIVRQADTADHEEGNLSAARNFYDYAAGKGWAPAALALAFTYDPHELQRRGVTVAAETGKARACYLKARELMDAAIVFYLSRLPPGRDDAKC